MNLKRSLAMALAVLFFLLILPVSAASGSFTDISDPDTALNVEVLQMMDVVGGVSYGRFEPNGSLTRAQFTKMAVMILGKGNQVANYQSFTIFPDVKSSHWASGYVNLAVRGEQKIISGYANGTFGPDQKITYGQAVTILMRLLGYSDSDVGMTWPTGYLNAAASAGLTDGVLLSGDSQLSRAQAVKLFVNLLRTPKKDGKVTFGESVASGVDKDVILLDAAAKADDGAKAVETTSGVVKLAGNHAPALLQGRRGTLLLDSKGNAWGFVPSAVGSVKDLTISSAKAGTIVDKEGKEYTLHADVKAYYQGKETTYGEVFVKLRSGNRIKLHFGLTGKVECVFVPETSTEEAIVIDQNGSASRLAALTGGRTDYSIYRNGEKVGASALRAYDVATYISGENQIQISTFRLTGRYEDAYPNTDAPSKITMLGHEFEVLPTAGGSTSAYRLGDQVTLLLTEDGKVAGLANPQKVRGDSVGIAKVDGERAKVELVEGITLEGKVDRSSMDYDGALVTVSSYKTGYLSLSTVRQGSGTLTLNPAERKLGSNALSADVQVFERVKTGPVAAIDLEDIRLQTVTSNQILYHRFNDNGKVDLLILDNVTGDRFTYGIAKVSYGFLEQDPENHTETVTIKYGDGKEIGPYLNGAFRTGDWCGIVVDQQKKKAVSYVKLTKLTNVSNAAWESDDSVFFNNKSYTVSDELICYNSTTGRWITLAQARAFGEKMTLYVDDFSVIRGIEV